MKDYWYIIFILFSFIGQYHCSYVDNYYCGEDNCYELLQITRDSSKAHVKKAFRSLASKTHPDKFQDEEQKKIASQKFQKLQTAYDILRDDEARHDYDYMLDNPDEFYMNYLRAWRRRNAPNVDVRIVIAVTISLISLVQYYNGWVKYEEAIKYFSTVPKYRIHATEEARKEGLLAPEKDKKRLRGTSKEEMKAREEKIIRDIIEKKMDIRGVYAKPTYRDILWVQLAFIPYWIVSYICWFVLWIWKFNILKREYGDEEKLYLIRKNMGMSQGQFDALEDHVREDYLARRLWLPERFKSWKGHKDHEMKAKLAHSGKYKAYKRYLKANGPGRIYFDD